MKIRIRTKRHDADDKARLCGYAHLRLLIDFGADATTNGS